MRLTVFCLPVLLLVSPAEGQRSPAIEAQQLPTYVTQLGKTHFPGNGAEFDDSTTAVVALRSGAVLVAGLTWGSLGELNVEVIPQTWPTPDAFLAHFDPSGNVEWIRQIGATTARTIPTLNGNPGGPGGDASGDDRAMDLAVASDGSIYVTGTTSSDLGETNSGHVEMFLAKFGADGSLQWLRQLGVETKAAFVSPSGGSLDMSSGSYGSSVLLDPSGAVYVAGSTGGDLAELNGTRGGDPGRDVFLARFTADGELQWLRQMGMESSALVGFDSVGEESLPEIALHPSGAIVMACESQLWSTTGASYVTLFTFDPHGEPLAGLAEPLGGFSAHLAVDPRSGRIFLGGNAGWLIVEEGWNGIDVFIASFDADLDFEWIRQLGAATAAPLGLDVAKDESLRGLCVDRAGDLILAGVTESSLTEPNAGGSFFNAASDIFAAKLSGSDGEILWASHIGKTTSALHGLQANGTESVGALALGPRGTIVIAGKTDGNLAELNAGEFDVVVMRLTPEGKL